MGNKIDKRRICKNCLHVRWSKRKRGYVSVCKLTERVVPPDMAGCQYWEGKYGTCE